MKKNQVKKLTMNNIGQMGIWKVYKDSYQHIFDDPKITFKGRIETAPAEYYTRASGILTGPIQRLFDCKVCGEPLWHFGREGHPEDSYTHCPFCDKRLEVLVTIDIIIKEIVRSLNE